MPVNQEVIALMRKYGGSFAVALAELWVIADPLNKKILEASFPDLFENYVDMERRRNERSRTR